MSGAKQMIAANQSRGAPRNSLNVIRMLPVRNPATVNSVNGVLGVLVLVHAMAPHDEVVRLKFMAKEVANFVKVTQQKRSRAIQVQMKRHRLVAV